MIPSRSLTAAVMLLATTALAAPRTVMFSLTARRLSTSATDVQVRLPAAFGPDLVPLLLEPPGGWRCGARRQILPPFTNGMVVQRVSLICYRGDDVYAETDANCQVSDEPSSDFASLEIGSGSAATLLMLSCHN